MRQLTFGLVLGVSSILAAPVLAQAPGQRIAPPEPAQGWADTQAPAVRQKTESPTESWAPAAKTPGFQAGAFTVLPSVTGAAFYDDNVFATNANRQGSWGGLVRPELGLTTAGRNYSFEARGYVERKWYDRFGSEDQTNGALGLATTLMVDPDTQVVAKAGYTRAHVDRGGGEALVNIFDKPLGYNVWEASGAINKRYGRVWSSVGVAGSWYNYDSATVGGVPVNIDYLNGNVGVLSGRVGYVVAPLTSLFVEVAGNRRNFHVDIFDSRGYRVVGGILLEPGQGARVKGEAYAGYMYQNYEGITFNTVSTFTYGGQLAWLIAPRWTAVAEGRRNALESGLNGGVSLVESLVAGRIDYAIAPNWFVGVGASYLVDEFKGAGRTDHSLSPLVSVKYLATPNITLGFDYRNVNFDSSGFGVNTYYRNVYLFSLNARI